MTKKETGIRQPLLEHDPDFYRTFLKLAGALILEQAAVLSVNLADNVMIGGYSETALSGVAAVNQIQFVIQQTLGGVANGVIVLASQYWGGGRTEPIKRLTGIGMRIAIVFAALMFAAVSLFPAQCVGLFVDNPDTIREGVRYLNIIRFTYPVFAVTTILLGTMRSVETVSLVLKVSLISLVVNCTINYLLIGGNLGAPELGVRGAAIGTLAARVLECAITLFYVLKKDRKLHLRLHDIWGADRPLLGDYMRTSLPIILQAALWGVLNAVQSAILGHMAVSAITAYSISSTMFLLLKVTAVGSCTAASIMVGKQIGSGKKEQLRPMVATMQLLFLANGAVLGLILFFIRAPLLRLYQISDETRSLANSFMIIQSVVLFAMSYQMPTNGGILRGGGDTRYALILDLISFCGIVIPLSYLAAFVWRWSPVIVVMLLNSDQAFKCVPAAIRVNRFRWAKKLTRDSDAELLQDL